MATQPTTVVSSSNFVPGTTLATSSIGAITGSMFGGGDLRTLPISSSYWTGSFSHTGSHQGASGSLGAITASQIGVPKYPTLLYTFTTANTGSGGGSFTAVTYVITGWNLATMTRETWSGASINTPNPSGNPLVDITVMGSYPPQNSAT